MNNKLIKQRFEKLALAKDGTVYLAGYDDGRIVLSDGFCLIWASRFSSGVFDTRAAFQDLPPPGERRKRFCGGAWTSENCPDFSKVIPSSRLPATFTGWLRDNSLQDIQQGRSQYQRGFKLATGDYAWVSTDLIDMVAANPVEASNYHFYGTDGQHALVVTASDTSKKLEDELIVAVLMPMATAEQRRGIPLNCICSVPTPQPPAEKPGTKSACDVAA